jgi:glycosyltransferase involved in cell wall biosynthesis
LRIAFVITDLEIGGAERMLLKLVSCIDRRRFEPVVISLTGRDKLAEQFEAASVPVYALGIRSMAGFASGLIRLVRLLRGLKPDLIQGWMVHGNFAATLGAAATRTPLLWGVRHSRLDPRVEKRSTVLIERMLARLSSIPRRIIYNSHSGRELHEALGYAAHRGIVVPNGFDVERFRPDAAARSDVRRELGIAADCMLAGMFARFHPVKDHAMLLDAVSMLREDVPGFRLLLAGEGCGPHDAALANLIDERALRGIVLPLGPRSDVEKLNAAIDVAVSSSRAVEGFSNSIGEAMAAGVPCVATDVGDAAAIVSDTGMVVPPGDANAFAAALRAIALLGADERREMGARARQRIVEQFSIEAVARQYEGIYMEFAKT